MFYFQPLGLYVQNNNPVICQHDQSILLINQILWSCTYKGKSSLQLLILLSKVNHIQNLIKNQNKNKKHKIYENPKSWRSERPQREYEDISSTYKASTTCIRNIYVTQLDHPPTIQTQKRPASKILQFLRNNKTTQNTQTNKPGEKIYKSTISLTK